MYPPKARPISDLIIDNKHRAKKRKRHSDEINTKEYYFKAKRSKVSDAEVELEAYSSEICRLISGKEYVPSARAYYDKNQYTGIASRFLPEFKTNYQNSLKIEETIIDALSSSHLKNAIINDVKDLISESQNEESGAFVSSLFSLNTMKSGYFKYLLSNYLDCENKFDEDSLKQLVSDINQRIQFINKNKMSNTNELTLCQHLNNLIEKYQLSPSSSNNQNNITIQQLERADQIAKNEMLDIEHLNSDEFIINYDNQDIRFKVSDLVKYRIAKGLATTLTTRYIFMEGDCNNSNMSKDGLIVDFGMTKFDVALQLMDENALVKILENSNRNSFKCTARDIRSFPHLRDAEPRYWPTNESSITQILFKVVEKYMNNDNIADNNSKLFSRIVCESINELCDKYDQFRQQEAPLLERLINYASMLFIEIKAWLLGKKYDELLAHERKERLFTFVGYFVKDLLEKNHDHVMQVERWLKFTFQRNMHVFTRTDNSVYKNLAHNPAFIFHKYKTLLKYCLTNTDTYLNIAKLYFSTDHQINNVPLSDVVSKSEEQRIDEIKTVLFSMPEFQEFLVEHGPIALEMIKTELSDYFFRYASKISHKSEYIALVNSFKVNELDEKFELLMNQCGLKCTICIVP